MKHQDNAAASRYGREPTIRFGRGDSPEPGLEKLVA
jgi:hypothetical protein